jgi:glycosyltransferase involved in cell wall biosynthesis
MNHRISVIIPVCNEQDAIEKVIGDIPRDLATEILVVDNGSTDETARLAVQMGARVIREDRRGYGWACLAGISEVDHPDIVVFLDGDYSDHPDEMSLVVSPILAGRADLVIGSRVLGNRERGALLPQARFGNWLFLRRSSYRSGPIQSHSILRA